MPTSSTLSMKFFLETIDGGISTGRPDMVPIM